MSDVVLLVATTMQFDGAQWFSVAFSEAWPHEADDLSVRFRTTEQAGLLVATRHDRSQDRLTVALEAGRVKVHLNKYSYSVTKREPYLGISYFSRVKQYPNNRVVSRD